MSFVEDWKSISLWQTSAALGLMGLILVVRGRNPEGWVRILDDANLIFHEAGHPLFGLFGQTLGLYGGTIGQLLLPLLCAGHFWKGREPAPFALSLAWFFENLLNISRYMADARAQLLPLVGGGEHDWVNIFANWHVIQYDLQIARAVEVAGYFGFVACGLWLVWRFVRVGHPMNQKELI